LIAGGRDEPLFAARTVILSVTGVYGIVSYLISQRTNEIFIAFLREGVMVGTIGIAVGLVGRPG
jgi:hypothetical protein